MPPDAGRVGIPTSCSAIAFSQEVSRPREPAAAHVARKPHAQALGLVESIRVQIAIYRPWKCFTPKRAQTLLHAECAAGPVKSERCRALEHEATKFLVAKELFLRLNFYGKAHGDVFSSTHTCTRQRIDSAVFFHRHLRLIVRSIGTQGRQGMGKMYGVGEEGEIPKEKSGVLNLNA